MWCVFSGYPPQQMPPEIVRTMVVDNPFCLEEGLALGGTLQFPKVNLFGKWLGCVRPQSSIGKHPCRKVSNKLFIIYWPKSKPRTVRGLPIEYGSPYFWSTWNSVPLMELHQGVFILLMTRWLGLSWLKKWGIHPSLIITAWWWKRQIWGLMLTPD